MRLLIRYFMVPAVALLLGLGFALGASASVRHHATAMVNDGTTCAQHCLLATNLPDLAAAPALIAPAFVSLVLLTVMAAGGTVLPVFLAAAISGYARPSPHLITLYANYLE